MNMTIQRMRPRTVSDPRWALCSPAILRRWHFFYSFLTTGVFAALVRRAPPDPRTWISTRTIADAERAGFRPFQALQARSPARPNAAATIADLCPLSSDREAPR